MPNPMDEMTEEQKEYEAMKLVNMFDKLSRYCISFHVNFFILHTISSSLRILLCFSYMLPRKGNSLMCKERVLQRFPNKNTMITSRLLILLRCLVGTDIFHRSGNGLVLVLCRWATFSS